MDRYQTSLNYVFLDKKEEYQSLKGGETNAETNSDEVSLIRITAKKLTIILE